MGLNKFSILEDTQIEQWLDVGVVCLPGIYNSKWLEVLEQSFQQSFENPNALSKDYAKDKKGSFFTDHAMHRRIGPINEFIKHSLVGKVAASLMSASKINLVDDHLLLKEPGTQNPTYWHQD